MSKRLLYVYRGEGALTRPAFADAMEAAGWSVEWMRVSHHAPKRGIPQILFSGRRMGRYDLIVANEYNLAWALALRLLLTPRTRIAVLGFNQSAKLILTGVEPADWLLNRIWRRISGFLVHSRDEARLFAKVHNIPADRFVFSHWGYDLPAHDPAATPLPAEPFVSMIGRNNRDVATFCRAVEKAGVGGVVITSADLAGRLREPVPPNVLLLSDRSMEDCLNYVAGSFAHLVLVSDGDRGAGHISAVSAMLLGKPQIFSRVATIEDYLIDDRNGIAVPLADPEATAAAIMRLRDDPALAERLGQAGQTFALRVMSHKASLGRSTALLQQVGEGQPLVEEKIG